jgi:hypothetical protein
MRPPEVFVRELSPREGARLKQVSNSTLVGCYSCGGRWSGRSRRLVVCWHVLQRPVQHLKIGWSKRTAWGRVRPAAGLLGQGAPG